MKKYYEILGLDMSASIAEVEQAYRKLSDVWRPQTYQNLPRYRRKAQIKSKEINEAYKLLRTFLLAKQPNKEQGEDQKDHVPPGETPLTPEPETLPAKETIQPQISKPPKKKTLLYSLIAIAVVLGVLMFYQFSDRKKPEQQDFQTVVSEPEKPTPTISSKRASTAPRQKESEAERSGEFTVAKQLPSGKSVGQKKHVTSNKRFIHSPAEKKPELYDQALAVSENQIEVLRSGIIDKTMKDEAVDNFGMKYANG